MDGFGDGAAWIGSVAGTLTTVAFLPQVLQLWRSRRARDISLLTMLVFSLGLVLWLLYGCLLGAWPVILANAVTLLLTGLILWMKLAWRDGPPVPGAGTD